MGESAPRNSDLGQANLQASGRAVSVADGILDADSVERYEEDADACWVQDIHHSKILWANRAAVPTLRANSKEELYARDVRPLSRTAETRLWVYQRRVSAGRVLVTQWTTFTLGKPITFRSEVHAYRIADGRIALFFKARNISDAVCPESLRMLDAARHSAAFYSLYAFDGQILERNAAFLREFGEAGSAAQPASDDAFSQAFVNPDQAQSIRQQVKLTGAFRGRAKLKTLSGERWHLLIAQRILDSVDGQQVMHCESFDISDQVEAESRARDSDHMMQRIADEFAHPVSYIDRDRVFRFVNRTYCRWIGRARDEIIGRRVEEVEGEALLRLWQANWPRTESGERISFERRRQVEGEGERWINVDVLPFRASNAGADGPVLGAIIFGYDIHALKIAQSSLHAKQLEMVRIADSLPVAVCKFDRDSHVLFANNLFCQWFDVKHETVVGRHMAELVTAEAYKSTQPMRDRAFSGETVFWRRFAVVRGREIWIDVTLAPATNENGEIDALIVVYTDVTARVRARQELSEARNTLTSHLANTPLAVIELDAERRVKEWTGRATEVFSWTRADAIGRRLDELKLFDEEGRSRFENELNWLDQATAERFTLQFRNLRRDGGAIHAEWYGSVLRDNQQRVASYLMLVQDISAKIAAEHHLQYVASHDLLTGLANRSQFHERLQTDIARAHRHKRQLAVVLIDLDRFKVVNDSLGHQAGDALLQFVAVRLRTAIGEGDLIARAGGDEFMVLLDLERDAINAETLVDQMREQLNAPFQLLSQAVYVTASIGASLYPKDADNATDLIKHADWAMFRAKDAGRNSVQFYSNAITNDSGTRLSLESDLRRVLEQNQLELHYQAKVDIATSRLTGAEALLRWRHPTRGLVPPESFIPLAEEMGLIVEIGAWVISEACRQMAAWQSELGASVQVAINLSAVQLRRTGLPDGILAELRRFGLPGSALMVEITETSVVTDPILASESLQALRNQGVRAAIDDFGKGFSSLIQLKRLPIDALKIDGSFVRDLAIDRDDAAIVNAIIGLAHNLDLKVVAEGVETPEQLAFLQKSGCDEAQGYLIARPLPAQEFAATFLRHLGATHSTGAGSQGAAPPAHGNTSAGS